MGRLFILYLACSVSLFNSVVSCYGEVEKAVLLLSPIADVVNRQWNAISPFPIAHDHDVRQIMVCAAFVSGRSQQAKKQTAVMRYQAMMTR